MFIFIYIYRLGVLSLSPRASLTCYFCIVETSHLVSDSACNNFYRVQCIRRTDQNFQSQPFCMAHTVIIHGFSRHKRLLHRCHLYLVRLDVHLFFVHFCPLHLFFLFSHRECYLHRMIHSIHLQVSIVYTRAPLSPGDDCCFLSHLIMRPFSQCLIKRVEGHSTSD